MRHRGWLGRGKKQRGIRLRPSTSRGLTFVSQLRLPLLLQSYRGRLSSWPTL